MKAGFLARPRFINLVQSAVLLAAMALLFGLCGWIIAGVQGLVALSVAGLALIALTPRASPKFILGSIGARPIATRDAPEIHAALAELSRRANLEATPRLFFVPWADMTAFTIGRRRSPSVIVSAGLLRGLDLRELTGVLAHEVAHIHNHDIWILGLADTVTRLTRFAATFGLFLLILNLPLMVTTGAAVSWVLVLAMILAPTISSLLQLGLTRTREFRADLEAAELSGDPEGLARALNRLERSMQSAWERLFGFGWRDPVPSVLRSHPATEERVRRLLSLTREWPRAPLRLPARIAMPDHLVSTRRRRPWHLGPWG